MAAIVARTTFSTESPAVVIGGETVTYGFLLAEAARIADALVAQIGTAAAASPHGPDGLSGTELQGKSVAVMAGPGADYVAAMFAVWVAGGVAVPLALSHPPAELEYVLGDSGAALVLATAAYEEKLRPIAVAKGIPLVPLAVPAAAGSVDAARQLRGALWAEAAAAADPARGALVIYTSGTTGRPKGALHTHAGVLALVRSLHTAWQWRAGDRIVHCLPLHHIHGIINAWMCCMYAGATCEFFPKFSMSGFWERVQNAALPPITIFMGVPTMFHYLLSGYDAMDEGKKAGARAAAAKLRLTISGSAACPVTVHEQWRALSGQKLLERYGMTEIGMALSNPLLPEEARLPGWVGTPLPGVEVKIVPFPKGGTDDAEVEEAHAGEEQGELRVRGAGVFREYIGRPEATASSFDDDGYFKTGDAVARCPERNVYRILGRSSVDIIKSGGYKLSALEIEGHLLHHPAIGECAVLGLDHPAMGQEVAVVLAQKAGGPPLPDLKALNAWGKDQMAPYKLPKKMVVLPEIPRNAMGKVNKVQLKKDVFTDPAALGDARKP